MVRRPVVGFYTITDEGRHTLAEARELAAVESQYGRRLPFFKRFARRRAA
jgi:DNA-binding PadR family transcriptional regulator